MTIEENKKSLFSKYYSSKTLFWTLLFGLSFWVFELISLPQSKNSVIYLYVHLDRGNYFRFLVVLSISIFAFCLFLGFIYAAFASSYKYKIIYFLIFSVLILTEYGYYKALEFFFRFEELEVALYGTDWRIISTAILYYFSYLALIPIAVFGILLLKTEKVFERSWKPFITFIFVFISFFFLTTYFTKNTYYVHSFNSGIRVLVSFPITWYIGTFYKPPRSNHYYTPRQEIGFKSSDKPDNNIVFIVDESIRSDRLSLNGNEFSTTPTLEKLDEKGFIKNWGIAVSGTTCSVTSNALLLTGLRDLPDTEYKFYKLPTIFQFAKAMNYKNFYFDGQLSTYWNGKASDVLDYGEWITANELRENQIAKYDVDTEIARRVKEIVNNSTGNFIWINKHGIQLSPINLNPDETKMSHKYDKAVQYNLENFFKELSGNESFGKNTVYVYTSDHGWILDEKMGIATHCQNTKGEANVPLLMISSPANLPEVDTGYKASHSNIFATLLDLMKFPEDKRKYDYAISLLKAKESDSKKRFYYVGDMYKKEEGKKYLFDE